MIYAGVHTQVPLIACAWPHRTTESPRAALQSALQVTARCHRIHAITTGSRRSRGPTSSNVCADWPRDVPYCATTRLPCTVSLASIYLAPILLAHKHPIHPTHAHAHSYACVSRRRGRVRGGGGVGLLYRGRFRRASRGREEQERQPRALHRLSLPADQGPLCHSECASTTDLQTPCDGNHLYRTTLWSEIASATLFDIVFRPVAQWASSTFPTTARA